MDKEYTNIDFSKRVCRSAICGGDPFIPDSEYQGGSCQLTCDVKDKEPNIFIGDWYVQESNDYTATNHYIFGMGN